jgi:hypothetical protein
MKICILTQTAVDISDYYKDFFRGRDIFFVTFKQENPNALAFMPRSTWSDGRNKLWEEVKGKYDYYIFIDDDLLFFKPKISFSPLATYLSHKALYRGHLRESYELASSAYFLKRLEKHLSYYKPEVLSALCFAHTVTRLDMVMMRKNSFARRLGWFDAQFTVLSNYAASKLLPYDTKISGWWSSQIPIYLYAYQVFGTKAIAVSDLAVINSVDNGAYVPNYNGYQDCQSMLAAISEATGKDFTSQFRPETVVDTFYGEKSILAHVPKPTDKEDYAANFQRSLKGLEVLLHPSLGFKN